MAQFIYRYGSRTRALEAPLSRAHAELAIPFSSVSSKVSFTTPHSGWCKFEHKAYSELKAICYERHACLEASTHALYPLPQYDSILAILASWPSAELPAISIVQNASIWLSDPTQPLAFTRLDDLLALASSPLLGRTKSLRLRIPWRKYSHLLIPGHQRATLPQITFLDLTSSHLNVSDVCRLLRDLPRLCHLVLDNCGLPDGHRALNWATFACSCMFAHSDLDLEKTVNRRLTGVSGEAGGSRSREARILPRTTALRTLSVSVPPHVDAEERQELLAAFRRGWGDAVTMFNMIISAARRSRVEEGTLVLRCPRPDEVGEVLRENDDPGLVVVDDEEFARLGEVRDVGDCPVVCLAGQTGRNMGIEHTEGCGHSIGWDIWEDTL
jgi:hypothetical protein